MKFSDLRVRTRLGLAFGVILSLMIILSLVAFYNLRTLQSDIERVIKDNNVRMEHTHTMLAAVADVRIHLRNVVLLSDPVGMRDNAAKISQDRSRYDQAYSALMKMPTNAQGQALREQIKTAAQAARPLNNQVLELGLADRNEEAMALMFKQAAPATEAWAGLLGQLLDSQRERNLQVEHESEQNAQLAMTVLIAGNLLGIALTLLFGFLVAHSITRQLGGEPTDANEVARSVAKGDLSIEVPLRPGDDSSMMAHFKVMVESLAQVVGDVRANAESVASVSQQIAQGNSDLSQRTEEQASALEQTAASMEELGSTARLNADNVKQASTLAFNASDVAVKGGEVVSQVIDTMKGINAASQKIGDIINVIDGIAFQTNILALNAAVEAARAGEQGRGFAVVASEVRTLAQRSAEAAKEVKQLISTSVDRVEQGSVLVDQAGNTMTEVVAAIKHVTDLMSEVNVAISEQTASVAQVSDAVSQMDQVTQQNAALVEQSAAAAASLGDQSRQMVQTVAVFKL